VAELLRGSRASHAVTVTCATDGNHGRAVAWGARRCGCRCVVFVHEGVSAGRVAAIAAFGAELRRVPGTYDDAVREADRAAREAGWSAISDTSWPGYLEVPRRVMQGYRLMADEALDQWDGPAPSHVFVQAGVGGLAAAVAVQMRARLATAPALIVVEPDRAACLLASAELGALAAVPGTLDTVMAGLACGEPSLLAWQELDRSAAAFMAVPDEAAGPCMGLLAQTGIVTGESGIAGLAALLLAAGDPAARETLGLGAESRVLLFGTEGATDAAVYERLVGRPPASVAGDPG
jgi:diaminopropionate ammonia-lyase